MSDQSTNQEQASPAGGIAVSDEVKQKLRAIEREKATLTPRKLQELSNAYVTYLSECESLKSPIETPDTARAKASKAGLEKFIGSTMLANAGQFIAAQHIVTQEYETLLRAITIVCRRIGILATPEIPETAPQQPVTETPAATSTN